MLNNMPAPTLVGGACAQGTYQVPLIDLLAFRNFRQHHPFQNTFIKKKKKSHYKQSKNQKTHHKTRLSFK